MNPPPVVPPIATIAPPGAPAIALDASGRIAVDIVCRKCGYNLRGLLPDGRCPECGTAVGRSLHGDLLRFSDPEWVQKLASGMNWIVASIVIGFLGGVMGVVFAALFMSFIGSRSFVVFAPLAGLVFGVFALVGYWKVTTPDPARLSEERGLSARKLVRIAQVTNYAVAPVNSLVQHFGWIPALAMSAVSGVIGLAGTFAVFVYGRKLALRIPDEKLARHCKIVMWGLSVTLAFTVVYAALIVPLAVFVPPTTATSAPVGTTTSGPSYSVAYYTSSGVTTKGKRVTTTTTTTPTSPVGVMAYAGASCFVGGGYLIFGIWALLLLLRFRRALNDSALVARQTWAAQPVGPVVGPPGFEWYRGSKSSL
jgi:MFS family permease